jgi:hypothetical protein
MVETKDCITEDEFRVVLNDACVAAGSRTAFARAKSIPPSTLSDILNKRRPVSESIANYLGYISVRHFVKLHSEKREPAK